MLESSISVGLRAPHKLVKAVFLSKITYFGGKPPQNRELYCKLAVPEPKITYFGGKPPQNRELYKSFKNN